jgi:hypothetical protein
LEHGAKEKGRTGKEKREKKNNEFWEELDRMEHGEKEKGRTGKEKRKTMSSGKNYSLRHGSRRKRKN